MTNYYDLPITLYGLGTKIGSRKLYERNGFSLIDDSYQFVVRDRNSSLLKSLFFLVEKDYIEELLVKEIVEDLQVKEIRYNILSIII